MEVRLFSNSSRPGVGMKPRRDSQRPLLPQHARHCPVLEAGSAVGFLVYPALEPNESFHIEYQGEGRYQFVYLMSTPRGEWMPIFTVVLTMPMGSIGMMKEDVNIVNRKAPITREGALGIMRAMIVPEDLGTPPGAIALRGATNFQTPPGWDTVYTSIFNMTHRPVAPMLAIRLQTDLYTPETEFRYVLQPGEGIPGAHNMPIGQVFFVPREEITTRECTEEELAGIRKARDEFYKEKAAAKVMTPHGLQVSPHYSRQSRAQKQQE